MTAKRVLFLDHAAALGGAERSLLLILAGLDKRSWQPVLGCVPGALREAARNLSVDMVAFEFPRLRRSARAVLDLFTRSRKIAAYAAAHRVDLLYANTVRSAIYGAMAARGLPIPFVWHMRDFWLSEQAPAWPAFDQLGKRWIGSQADRILANSQAVARYLPRSAKVDVVYNGVDIDRFKPSIDGREFRKSFAIPPDAPLVGTIGRLRPWKGIDRFIRIASQIARNQSDICFMVIGGSPFQVGDGYAENLPRLAEQLNITDRVIFTGHLEDVRPALAAMDVFVHAGEPEPFGLVNIEAMAMQLPVVAFAHGALPEIVSDGETGILVAPGNDAGLDQAILDLLNHPEKRTRMGRAGRKRVESSFSSARMVTEISDLLNRLIP